MNDVTVKDLFPVQFDRMKILTPIEWATPLVGFVMGIVIFFQGGFDQLAAIAGMLAWLISLACSIGLIMLRMLSYLIHFFQFNERFQTPLLRTLSALLGGSDRLGIK